MATMRPLVFEKNKSKDLIIFFEIAYYKVFFLCIKNYKNEKLWPREISAFNKIFIKAGWMIVSEKRQRINFMVQYQQLIDASSYTAIFAEKFTAHRFINFSFTRLQTKHIKSKWFAGQISLAVSSTADTSIELSEKRSWRRSSITLAWCSVTQTRRCETASNLMPTDETSSSFLNLFIRHKFQKTIFTIRNQKLKMQLLKSNPTYQFCSRSTHCAKDNP